MITNHSTALALSLALGLGAALPIHAAPEPSQLISGDILSHFKKVEGWNAVQSVEAIPGKCELKVDGTGSILTNGSGKKSAIPYLVTSEEFKDVQVHLEFMIPKGSNAGIYLMGRYEIQIFDSFGTKEPSSSDMGGIYQRYDNNRNPPGYEGVRPTKGAAKPPGEWQTFDITFRAPRFDDSGKKIENARFEKVVVNGETVHENKEVKGPTRAHPISGEAALGPIAIQGDHGPIAIRSFKVDPRNLNE